MNQDVISSLNSETLVLSIESTFDSLHPNEHLPAWSKLLKNLSNFYLDSLKLIFAASSGNTLTKNHFCDVINEFFGEGVHTTEALALFKEMNNYDEHAITWNQFLDFLTKNIRVEIMARLELSGPLLITVPHLQRDSIRKLVLVESEKYFSYAVVSIYGKVGLYDGNMELLNSYSVIMTREDLGKSDEERRKRNRWITDVIFMEDVSMIVFANSTRSIIIYDASGMNHVPIWLIIGCPNIIECLSYNGKNSSDNNGILYIGYDNGKRLSINFLKHYDLFLRKHKDKLTILYWEEIRNDKEYTQIKRLKPQHNTNTKHMDYCEEQNILISSSKDSKTSVIIDHIKTNNHSYIFNMHWGANCFAYNSNLNILITGSEDGFLRIWNPVVTSRPIHTMNAHQHGVIDIAIFSTVGFFISLSRDAELRVWDLKEYQCMQVMKIKFPCFNVRGKTIDWGIKCIFPGPKRQSKQNYASNKPASEWLFEDGDLDVEIATRKEENEKLSGDKWERSNILIICCNSVCKITLNYYDDKSRNFDDPILPVQPLLNSVLIPNNWSECTEENFPEMIQVVNKGELEDHLQEKIDKQLKELSFILEKDLRDFSNSDKDTNNKIAQIEDQKVKMQFHVSQGAPFLALDLHEPKDIEIAAHLPIPKIKKIEKLVAHARGVLSNAKARSIIFSDRSSSTKSPRSSRSSFMEFN